MGFYDWPWNSIFPRLAEWVSHGVLELCLSQAGRVGTVVSRGKWPDQGKESQQDGRTRSWAEVWAYDHGAAGAGQLQLMSVS